MRYERPVVIKTYSLSELQADAAACSGYYPATVASDERLKTDIEPV